MTGEGRPKKPQPFTRKNSLEKTTRFKEEIEIVSSRRLRRTFNTILLSAIALFPPEANKPSEAPTQVNRQVAKIEAKKPDDTSKKIELKNNLDQLLKVVEVVKNPGVLSLCRFSKDVLGRPEVKKDLEKIWQHVEANKVNWPDEIRNFNNSVFLISEKIKGSIPLPGFMKNGFFPSSVDAIPKEISAQLKPGPAKKPFLAGRETECGLIFEKAVHMLSDTDADKEELRKLISSFVSGIGSLILTTKDPEIAEAYMRVIIAIVPTDKTKELTDKTRTLLTFLKK